MAATEKPKHPSSKPGKTAWPLERAPIIVRIMTFLQSPARAGTLETLTPVPARRDELSNRIQPSPERDGPGRVETSNALQCVKHGRACSRKMSEIEKKLSRAAQD